MMERVWTVVGRDEEEWRLVHETSTVAVFQSRDEAVEAAVAAARKAAGACFPASVLIEEGSIVREIWPRRKARRRRPSRGAAEAAGGYELNYFANKFRIPLADARRIMQRVGQDRAALNAAALDYKRTRSDGF